MLHEPCHLVGVILKGTGMEKREDPHREKIHTACACIASGPSLSMAEEHQGPAQWVIVWSWKRKGEKHNRGRGGEEKTGEEIAQSIV